MKTKHTPGTWRVILTGPRRSEISTPGNPYVLATVYEDNSNENARDNAERIVACVNACAGIEDPAAYIEAMRRELRRLVDLCDTEATMFDGSNPDTRAAHALLGDFDKPADEDDGGWRY
jgi:regulator of RNase E activity RraB